MDRHREPGRETVGIPPALQDRPVVEQRTLEFVQAMPVVRTFDSGSTSFGRFQRALLDYRAILQGWGSDSVR